MHRHDCSGGEPAFRFAPTHEHPRAVPSIYLVPSYVIAADAAFMIVSDSDS